MLAKLLEIGGCQDIRADWSLTSLHSNRFYVKPILVGVFLIVSDHLSLFPHTNPKCIWDFPASTASFRTRKVLAVQLKGTTSFATYTCSREGIQGPSSMSDLAPWNKWILLIRIVNAKGGLEYWVLGLRLGSAVPLRTTSSTVIGSTRSGHVDRDISAKKNETWIDRWRVGTLNVWQYLMSFEICRVNFRSLQSRGKSPLPLISPFFCWNVGGWARHSDTRTWILTNKALGQGFTHKIGNLILVSKFNRYISSAHKDILRNHTADYLLSILHLTSTSPKNIIRDSSIEESSSTSEETTSRKEWHWRIDHSIRWSFWNQCDLCDSISVGKLPIIITSWFPSLSWQRPVFRRDQSVC